MKIYTTFLFLKKYRQDRQLKLISREYDLNILANKPFWKKVWIFLFCKLHNINCNIITNNKIFKTRVNEKDWITLELMKNDKCILLDDTLNFDIAYKNIIICYSIKAMINFLKENSNG